MKRKLKNRLAMALAESVGYYLLKRRREKGPYPSAVYHVASAASTLGYRCILDVGGHFGHYACDLRRRGYEGWIVSFEPSPPNFERLRQRAARDPRWKVFDYALGAEDTTQELLVANAATLASFCPSTEYGRQRFGALMDVKERVPVTIKRLDGVIDEVLEGTGAHEAFLKMDTQGYDLSVFEGARGCRDRIAGLQSELSVKPIYEDIPSYVEGLKTYRDAGYQAGGFYPVQFEGQALMEIDVVMFRSDLASGVRAATG